MPRYFINGKTYNIPDDKAQDFLAKNQGATEIEPIADFKTETEKYAKQVKKRVEAGYFDPTGEIETKVNKHFQQFQNQLETSDANQWIQQANDLSGVGLSDPNQGAFGNMQGTPGYFSPKPLLPELNIEEYIAEDTTIDDPEEKLKYYENFLNPKNKGKDINGIKSNSPLTPEEYEDFINFYKEFEATKPTDKQKTKVNSNADELFSANEKTGLFEVTNLNPDNLRTEDFYRDRAGFATKFAGGPGGMNPVAADKLFSFLGMDNLVEDAVSAGMEFVDDARDAGNAVLNWLGIGEEKKQIAVDESTQTKIDTQKEYLLLAQNQLTLLEEQQGKPYEELGIDMPKDQWLIKTAKDLYIDNSLYGEGGIMQTNQIDYFKDNYSKSEYGIGLWKTDEQKEKHKLYEVAMSTLGDVTKQSLANTKNAVNEIERIDGLLKKIKDGPKPKNKQELIERYAEIEVLIKERNKQQSIGEHNAGLQEFEVNGMEDVKQFGDLMGRNYNGLAQWGKLIPSVVDIGHTLVKAKEYLTPSPREMFNNVIKPLIVNNQNLPDSFQAAILAADVMGKAIDNIDEKELGFVDKTFVRMLKGDKAERDKSLQKWTESFRNSLQPPQAFSDIDTENGFVEFAQDAGNWAVDFTTTQGPQLALMVLAPQVALPILTTSAFGGKILEMETEMREGVANYTLGQIYTTALMTAGAEYFSEKVTLGQLKRLKIKNIPVKTAKTNFLQSLKQNILDPKFYKRAGRRLGAYAYDINEEGFTEVLATMGENFASKYVQGKEEVGIYDNIKEAYVGGVFMSGVMFRAPAMANQILAPFKTNKVETAFNDNAYQIKQLSQELGKDIDQKTRDIITNKINSLVQANVELRLNNSLAVDLLSQDQKNELVSLEQQRAQNNNAIKQLESEAKKGKKDAASIAALEQEINQFKIENGKLDQKRDDIMQPVIEERLNMGIEFAETQAKKLAGLEGSKLSGNVIQTTDLTPEQIVEKYGEGADQEAGFFDPETGDIVINPDIAAKFELVTVASHELFHGILKTEMAKNPELAKEFSVNFKKILSKSELNVVNQRLKAYENETSIDENGVERPYLEVHPDEILTQFSEAVLAGEVKFNESLFDKIRKIITPVLKQVGFPKVEFKNAQETYDFIKEYTKFVKQSTVEGDATFDISATGDVDIDASPGFFDAEGRAYVQNPRQKEEEITDEQVIKRIKEAKQGSDVYTQKEFDTMKDIMVKEQRGTSKALSKPTTKGIPAEYDVDRIKTNLELNRDIGQTFLREDNRKILETQLARAEKVEGFIDKSPAELREMLANETNPENKTDLEYALKRQQEVRFPGNVGVTDPLTGKPIKPSAPKGVAFSKAINPKNIVQNLNKKGLKVSEKQINDMVGKIASRATTKFWSRMSASNQNIVPRKLYKDSAKNLLLEIANNYRKEVSKNTGKQVTFDAYMANTGMQRLNSLAADLGAKQKDDKSLSDEATLRKAEEQQTTEETTVAKPEVTPTIDVMSFPKITDSSVNTKTFEKDFSDALIKNAKAKGIDLSDPNLTTAQLQSITPYNILADALGIPANKISNPKANLSKDESLKIQRALLKARSFVKNVVLGKANKDVQEVASKVKGGKPVKIGGESLKLGRNILTKFFNPPKRLGSGQMVRTPKKFDNKVYEQSIGIKDGKVDPNYKPRDAESQVMKGFVKAIAEQMANRSVRLDIASKPQTPRTAAATANLERGKSGLAFARKNVNKKLLEKHKDGIVLDNRNPEHVKIFENVWSNEASQYLPVHETGGIFTAGSFANSGTKESSRLKGYQFLTSSELAKLKRKAKKNEGTFTKKERKNVKIAGSSKDGYWKKMGQASYLDTIKQNYDGFKFVLFGLKKMYDNAKGNVTITLNGEQQKISKKALVASAIGAWMNNVSDGNKHFLRNAAIPKMLDPAFLKANGMPNFEISIAEHNVMANDMVDKAFNDGILDGKLDTVFEFLVDNYFQSLIAKTDDGKLSVEGSHNFDDSTPPEVQKAYEEFLKTGDKSKIVPILFKYFHPKVNVVNGGFNPNTFNFLGQPLTQIFNVQVPKDLQNNPNVIAQQQDLISQQLLGNDVKTKLNQFAKSIPQFQLNEKGKIRTGKALSRGRKYQQSKRGEKAIKKLEDSQPKDLDKGFNDIIQETKGIKSEARYSDIGARRAGRTKGRFRFFIPPGAEDFKGLLYNFLGKGKAGERHFEFFDKNLLKPYWQAIAQIERARRALKNDYATLLKNSPDIRKKLGQKIPTKGKTQFTYDHAIRAYLMTESGYDLTEAGLSKRDAKLLSDTVKNNPELVAFAKGLQLISKQDKWLKPTGGFDVQTIQSDIHRFTSGEGRKKFLENSGFIQNVDQIFSKQNLNKIEAAYGKNVREALEDTIYRMKNGTNRPAGTNRLTNTFNNWVNRSVGAIMFFNRKSALLQTISSVNFINWSDNNPLKAAMAFANQKQYWSDFAFIFNSPKLKERRAGLKGDINEAELADAARGATNKAEAVLSYLLKIGFTPTQLADSFAIASGGATFYRNRINTYLKQGMNQQAAEKKAWEDFSRISEESQQSADPAMISEQQASPLGRFTLNFQNTPMQYTRLMKRAGQDLINRRRIPGLTQAQSDATYISKIIYYGAVQNFIFAALQNALFAVIPGFGDDEEEEELTKEQRKRKKELKIANNMVDTILRGTGIYGAIAATLKNTLIKFYENEGKDPFAKDNADIILEAANLSPVIGSKLRKLNNALKTREFEKDVIEERGWEITRDGKLNLSPSYNVLGSTAEALLNVPLERTIAEIDALVEMTDQRNSSLERIALALGWRTWDIGVPNEEEDQIKIEVKERKKQERKDKLKREREEKKRLEEEKRFEGLSNKEINNLKRRDQIEVLTKQQQIDSLIKLGVSKKDIRALRLESDRIDKIIELNTK